MMYIINAMMWLILIDETNTKYSRLKRTFIWRCQDHSFYHDRKISENNRLLKEQQEREFLESLIADQEVALITMHISLFKYCNWLFNLSRETMSKSMWIQVYNQDEGLLAFEVALSGRLLYTVDSKSRPSLHDCFTG